MWKLRRGLLFASSLGFAALACKLQISVAGTATERPEFTATDTFLTEEGTDQAELRAPTTSPSPESTSIETAKTFEVNQDSRCRGGPGLRYDTEGFISAGQDVNVMGKNADSSWWYIALPDGSNTCWISGSLGTLVGDPNSLPMFTPGPTTTLTPIPPSSTPTPDFTVDFNGYCKYEGYNGAALEENTAFGWRCEDSNGNLYNIIVENACDWQYGLTNASYSDFNDPYSWRCEP